MVCLVFFAAKLTTIHGRSETGETDFLFYVPAWVQVSRDWRRDDHKTPMLTSDWCRLCSWRLVCWPAWWW